MGIMRSLKLSFTVVNVFALYKFLRTKYHFIFSSLFKHTIRVKISELSELSEQFRTSSWIVRHSYTAINGENVSLFVRTLSKGYFAGTAACRRTHRAFFQSSAALLQNCGIRVPCNIVERSFPAPKAGARYMKYFRFLAKG